MRITLNEKESARKTDSIRELDDTLEFAKLEAIRENKLNIVFLEANNGNELSVVVGGDETVLGFTFSDGNPPYYASKGNSEDIEPILSGFVGLEHHTEYTRSNVISSTRALLAIHEFFNFGDLPKSIQWVEV